MVGMKTKFRNKQQLSKSLLLKITRTDVDVNTVNSNRKQAHQSHTRLIMRNRSISFFVKLYTIIDCRSTNLVEVLKRLGSTDLGHYCQQYILWHHPHSTAPLCLTRKVWDNETGNQSTTLTSYISEHWMITGVWGRETPRQTKGSPR
jgi:hypothetical protein